MNEVEQRPVDDLETMHRRALEEMTQLVSKVGPPLLERPTPCEDWNVRQLIEHTVGLNYGIAEAASSGEADLAAYAPRPASMWAESADLALRALGGLGEGQKVTVAPVTTEFPFDPADVRTIHLLDVLVHAWDLAAALGLDYQPPAPAAAVVGEMAAQIAARALPSTREQFAAPIRSAQGDDRGWSHILRLLGRDPQWESPAHRMKAPALEAVSIAERLDRFSETWSPKIIGRVNDYEIKVVKMLGEFEWHTHEETDELFVVISGHMRIEMRHGSVELGPGDLYVVPRGVEHRPVAEGPTESVLLEPAGVINTGDAGGSLTAVDEVLI